MTTALTNMHICANSIFFSLWICCLRVSDLLFVWWYFAIVGTICFAYTMKFTNNNNKLIFLCYIAKYVANCLHQHIKLHAMQIHVDGALSLHGAQRIASCDFWISMTCPFRFIGCILHLLPTPFFIFFSHSSSSVSVLNCLRAHHESLFIVCVMCEKDSSTRKTLNAVLSSICLLNANTFAYWNRKRTVQ